MYKVHVIASKQSVPSITGTFLVIHYDEALMFIAVQSFPCIVAGTSFSFVPPTQVPAR